jgi:competence protein ComFC
MKISVRTALDAAMDLLYPRKCVHCNAEGEFLCESCTEALETYPRESCSRCLVLMDRTGICSLCAVEPSSLDRLYARWSFDDEARDAVHALKYGGVRAIAPLLGRMMAEKLAANRAQPDILVPVPLHGSRLRERGYNQAELLCREVSAILGLPFRTDLLTRVKRTEQQAMLRGNDRTRNVSNAFASGYANGLRVMIVDDVSTSGSTLFECARALKSSGATGVAAAVFAKEQ